MFFGKTERQNMLDQAGREPALRTPTTLRETVSTAFLESVGNGLSVSFIADRNRARSKFLDQIEETSGLKPNLRLPNQREQDKDLRKRFEQLREFNQELPEFPLTKDNTDAEIRALRQARRDASSFARLGEQGFVSGFTRFVGGTAGFLADPINILSMGIGGLGRSVLTTAIKQAAIGAGSEIPIQAAVQAQRAGIGEQPSLGEAAFAIGSAGVGAGVLGGALAAAGRGLGRVLGTRDLIEAADQLPPSFRTQEVKDAQAVLSYLDDLEQRNPFPNTPAGRAQHQQRLQKMFEALRDGRPVAEAFEDTPLPKREGVVQVRTGEPAQEFLSRVRSQNEDLFNQIDKLDKDLAKAGRDLERSIEQNPPVSEAELAQARQFREVETQLKKARKDKADRRKIKRLENKLKDLDDPKGIERRAKAADRARAKEEKLRKRQTDLAGRKTKLEGRANKAAQRIDPIQRTINETRELVDTTPDLPDGVKDVQELGEILRALALARGARTDVTTSVGSASRAIDDIIEETDSESAARVDLIEAQVRELADLEDGTTFQVADPDGNVREVSARELLDDLEKDQKLVRELQGCIAGALT